MAVSVTVFACPNVGSDAHVRSSKSAKRKMTTKVGGRAERATGETWESGVSKCSMCPVTALFLHYLSGR